MSLWALRVVTCPKRSPLQTKVAVVERERERERE
jgi:hypothetical protein